MQTRSFKLFLAVSLVAVLAGCGGGDAATEAEALADAPTEAPTEHAAGVRRATTVPAAPT